MPFEKWNYEIAASGLHVPLLTYPEDPETPDGPRQRRIQSAATVTPMQNNTVNNFVVLNIKRLLFENGSSEHP